MPDLTVNSTDISDVSVMPCTGELDMASVGPLLAPILDRLAHAPVVVDLSGVTFLDCVGLSALLSAQRSAWRAHRGLCFAAPSPAVVRLLHLTGTYAELELHAHAADAVAGLRSRAVWQLKLDVSPTARPTVAQLS
jgi:anti-sigma B factor antagonist